MQYFYSLKFHERQWTQTDSKAFSEATKVLLAIPVGSWGAQPSEAGQGGEQGEPLLLSSCFATETQLGAAKHQTVCDQQITLFCTSLPVSAAPDHPLSPDRDVI